MGGEPVEARNTGGAEAMETRGKAPVAGGRGTTGSDDLATGIAAGGYTDVERCLARFAKAAASSPQVCTLPSTYSSGLRVESSERDCCIHHGRGGENQTVVALSIQHTAVGDVLMRPLDRVFEFILYDCFSVLRRPTPERSPFWRRMLRRSWSAQEEIAPSNLFNRPDGLRLQGESLLRDCLILLRQEKINASANEVVAARQYILSHGNALNSNFNFTKVYGVAVSILLLYASRHHQTSDTHHHHHQTVFFHTDLL